MSDAPAGSGSIQGLDWYTSSMQLDADGDEAQEFYVESDSTRPRDGQQPATKQQKLAPTLSKRQGTQPLGPSTMSVSSGKVMLTSSNNK